MEGTWFWGNKTTIISRSGGDGTRYFSIWMDKKTYLSGGRNVVTDTTKAPAELDVGAIDSSGNSRNVVTDTTKAPVEVDEGAINSSGKSTTKQSDVIICGAVDMLSNLKIGANPAEVDEGAIGVNGNRTELNEKLEVDEATRTQDSKCTSKDTGSRSSGCVISKKSDAFRSSDLQPTRTLPFRTRQKPLRYREQK